ncbi:hypothetical protein TeGR_g30 [Tetraparma gracilis]|uniref:Uncharacterized protein n=1 Tax=Tetraparma gracilis TaxID=2962635 RepID=A0ABQ6N5K8_9STRA|nr:hypothetical protein TeGR_g30 [Tetraparma gracilis]
MLQLYPEGRLVATYRRSDRSGAAEVASFCLTSKTSVERSQASRPLPPSADDSDSESSYRAAIQQKIGKKGSSGLSGKLSGKLFGSKPAALPVSTEITDALVVRLNDATGSFLELFPYSAASVESTLQVWEESAGSVIEKLREAGAAPSEPVTATSVLGEDDGGRESSTTEKLAALLGNKGILTAEDLGEVKRLMQRKSRAGESGTEPALISREEAVKREYLGGVGGGGEKKGSGRDVNDIDLNFIDTPLGSVHDTKVTMKEHLFLERQSSDGMESALASACEAQLDSLILSTSISLPSSRLTNVSAVTSGTASSESPEERLKQLMCKKLLPISQAMAKAAVGKGKDLSLLGGREVAGMREKKRRGGDGGEGGEVGGETTPPQDNYGRQIVEQSLEAQLDDMVLSTGVSRPLSVRSNDTYKSV